MSSSNFSLLLALILILICQSADTKTTHSPPSQSHLSIPLFHRDMLAMKKNNVDYKTLVNSYEGSLYHTSVYNKLGGDYVAYFWVGSPPQRVGFLIDTGSRLMWLQCLPCEECYNQTEGPIFDPAQSSSYQEIECNSIQCHHEAHIIEPCNGYDYEGISTNNSTTAEEQCRYHYGYADGETTGGRMIKEKLTFIMDQEAVENIVMGCSDSFGGNYTGKYAGILGLNHGPYSILDQLGVTNFSFCLPNPSFKDLTTLDFFYPGPKSTSETVITPFMIPRFEKSNQYYVSFSGISINDILLPIPLSYWHRSSSSGNGDDNGVLIDSGSSITWFPKEVYTIFRDSFVKFTSKALHQLEHPATIQVRYDACFKRHPFEGTTDTDLHFPIVKFHFISNSMFTASSITLTTSQLFLDMDNNTYCLAFAPASYNFTIIGSHQLQGTRLTFDLYHNNLILSPNDCS